MTNVKRPRKPMTGEEYDVWLKETGQYEAVVERQREYQEALRQRRAERDAALKPVEEELHAAGAPSISKMFSQTPPPNRYKAIPILLAHLPKDYPHDARNLIALALQKPEVRAHWHVLTKLYRDECDEDIKGQLGCNIGVLADAAVLDEVIALVRDKTQGSSRVGLLSALDKSKDLRAQATIDELANDPDLREEIKAIFKRREQRKKRRLKRLH